MVYYKVLGRSEFPTKNSSTAIIFVLAIQTLVILIVYPFIIGTVVLRFREDVRELEIMIQEMSGRQTIGSRPMKTQRGTSIVAVNGSDVSWRCTDCSLHGGSDREQDGSSTGLSEWCVSDQQQFKMMLLKMVWEEIRHRNKQSQGMTLGAVERLVESMVNINHTQTRKLSPLVFPVAVHLTSGPLGFFASKKLQNERGKVKVGPWESIYGEAFSVHVGIDDFNIIIPKTGLYYVYSQAYFRDEREDTSRVKSQITEYLHYTVLESTAYSAQPINLMKSGRTKSGKDNTEYYYSSFHAGVFKLREGDKIYMKVYLASEEVKLDCRQESTYMGLYLVSSN